LPALESLLAHLNQPGLASLFVQSRAYQMSVTLPARVTSSAIVDKDPGCAGRLDVHVGLEADGHDVGSTCGSGSRGDGRIPLQADPVDGGAGNM